MGLVKRTYTDRETVITAENLNEIQDAILALEDGLFSVDNDKSGEIITITDAAKRGFRSLNIYGKTTQDGTPTPDAPAELVSVGDGGSVGVLVAGKNLVNTILNGSQSYGYAVALSCEVDALEPNTEYAVSFVGAAGHKIYANEKLFAYSEFVCNGNRQYVILKTQNSISKTREDQYSASGRWIIFKNSDGNTVAPNFNDVQIERGLTPTTYEPYKGQSLTISTPNGLPGIPVTSGGNYTDANGQQWVCDEIDLARGVYVQRCFRETVQTSYDEPYGRYTGRLAHNANNLFTTNDGITVVCDKLSFNGQAAYGINGVRVSTYNPDTLVAYYNGENPGALDVIYPLATPIETPLTEEELAAYAALHTYKDHATVSNDAGAYIELEYVMDAKKYIDSLVIGGGGASARLSSVSLPASKWAGADSLYSQVVTIEGITEYSKVDLLPSVEQLAIFHNKDVTFVTENEDGVVTVYAIGEKPVLDYTMQVQITEVVV